MPFRRRNPELRFPSDIPCRKVLLPMGGKGAGTKGVDRVLGS